MLWASIITGNFLLVKQQTLPNNTNYKDGKQYISFKMILSQTLTLERDISHYGPNGAVSLFCLVS